jgi:signal transduction histidine kinase
MVLAGALAAGMAFTALAQDKKPTQDEAKALTQKAAALIAAEGPEKACEAFNAKGSEWYYGEIYVNIIDPAGIWRCYPPKPAGVGNNVINVKDADGKFLVQDIIKLAKDTGEGWVEYRWMNPASSKIEPKITYVKAVPAKDVITYVGIYK